VKAITSVLCRYHLSFKFTLEDFYYLDQLGDNTTEIKHRISQTIKATNDLNCIWWQKKLQKI
jgi:hypothetical protein